MIIHLRDEANNRVFNYRAAAVVVHDDHVLLHRNHYDRFWSMPGGRVDMGEESERTVVREMREELGAVITVERLLFVIENFFIYDERNHHELAMYFLARLNDASPFIDKSREYVGIEDDQQDAVKLVFRWVRLDAIAKLDMPLYPPALASMLREGLPDTVQYRTQHSGRRG